MGSTTEIPDTLDKGGKRIECNTIDAIRNSASKLRMKEAFNRAEVKTANWVRTISEVGTLHNNWESSIVAKSIFGSRGQGNTLIKNQEELDQWRKGRDLNHYIFEAFHNYALEFRLHITTEGCFYTCRKALKADVPESEKWRRHDDICVWLKEDNEGFKRPNSWKDIESDCVKALKEIGADVLSFDVKVQGAETGKGKSREYQEYILIECNSASSFGDVTAQKYIEEIPKILRRKYNGL